MGTFWKKVEKLFTKKTTIFGKEIYIASFSLIILFSGLATFNLFNFILAVIAGDFYWALGQLLLFSWNTGLLYYNWLLNKMQIEIAKSKN